MTYLSYCGLLCDECPIFIATKEENESMKEQLAKDCSNENFTFAKEDMNCLGCFDVKTKDSKMCGACTIRICASEKGVENCGYCDSYPCEEVTLHVVEGSDGRKRLDAIYSQQEKRA